MSAPANWRDVKAKVRTIDHEWDSPGRGPRRAEARGRMLASVSGRQRAEICGQLGITQAPLVEATGLTQTRISQM